MYKVDHIMEGMKIDKNNLAPIDGIRALTHLSLIALHAAMMVSAHLPSEGPLWKAVKSNFM
jgi:hypothetical protein